MEADDLGRGANRFSVRQGPYLGNGGPMIGSISASSQSATVRSNAVS
jgi:hypothetical protein